MQTVRGLNVTELKLDVPELKLDRLIDDMRFLRVQMIGCNRRLQEIETYLKPSELDEGRAPVANPRRIEQAVHAYLAPKRVNKRREFFAVTVEQAINTIRSLSEEVRRRDELAAAEARYRNTLTAAKAALAAKENWRRGVLTNRKEMEALAALLALRDGLKIEDLQLPRDKPVLPGGSQS